MTQFLQDAPEGFLLDEVERLRGLAKREAYGTPGDSVVLLCTTVEILAALLERAMNENKARELVEAGRLEGTR